MRTNPIFLALMAALAFPCAAPAQPPGPPQYYAPCPVPVVNGQQLSWQQWNGCLQGAVPAAPNTVVAGPASPSASPATPTARALTLADIPQGFAPWSGITPVNAVYALGADPTGTNDSTSVVQTWLSGLPSTGGYLYFPPGNFTLHGLQFANAPLRIDCAGKFVTTLTLKAGSSTYLAASHSYWANTTTVDPPVSINHCGVNFNSATGSSSPGLILETHQSDMNDDLFENSSGAAVEFTPKNSAGACLGTSMGNNRIRNSYFSNSQGPALQGLDSHCNLLADVQFDYNYLFANAQDGTDWQIESDRAAGWSIRGNWAYGSPGYGDLDIVGTATNVITDNRFDSTNNVANGATPVESIIITEQSGNFGCFTFTGNALDNRAASLPGSATGIQILNIVNNQAGCSGTVSGNTFNMINIAGSAITYSGSQASCANPLIALGNQYATLTTQPSGCSIFTGVSPVPGTAGQVWQTGGTGGAAAWASLATPETFTLSATFTAGATAFLPPSGWSNAAVASFGSNTAGSVKWPNAGRFNDLTCSVTTAPGTGQSYVCTLFVANLATLLTCTISNAATSCTDNFDIASAIAGNAIATQVVASAGVASNAQTKISMNSLNP